MRSCVKVLLLLIFIVILQSVLEAQCKKNLKNKVNDKSKPKEISKYLESCVLDNMNIKHKGLLSDFRTCLKNIKSKKKISGKKDKKSNKLWADALKTTKECWKSKVKKSSKSNSKTNKKKNKGKNTKRPKRSLADLEKEMELMNEILKQLEVVKDVDQCSSAPSKSQILYFCILGR